MSQSNDPRSSDGVRKTGPGQAGAHGADRGHRDPQIESQPDRSDKPGGQIAEDQNQSSGSGMGQS